MFARDDLAAFNAGPTGRMAPQLTGSPWLTLVRECIPNREKYTQIVHIHNNWVYWFHYVPLGTLAVVPTVMVYMVHIPMVHMVRIPMVNTGLPVVVCCSGNG